MKKDISYMEILTEIDDCKKYFEKQLEVRLGLIKVPGPLFIESSLGIQDQLNGVEKAISFKKGETKFEIVHSLAKWKRVALSKYNIPLHKGIYTNMKAIRKDETLDRIHSLYVEQWDWEKVIDKNDRSIEYLKENVRSIYKAIRQTAIYLKNKYHNLTINLPKSIYFITSQELENMYPNKTPFEREQIIGKEKGAVFIIGIGDKLKSGKVHDMRSPDYDDWHLNGDLLIYDKAICETIELSSMGIRVDEQSLKDQLKKSKCMDRIKLPYHQMIMDKKLPYSIGGGIGESRLIMLLLQKQHIAEVQPSYCGEKDFLGIKAL